jgi:hypothetical protein
MTQTTTPEPATTPDGRLLSTLAPALRQLEHSVRVWLRLPQVYPRPLDAVAALEGMADDLRRQAEALEAEKPLLIIMLMGGTGVGKSSLLNALAGDSIAQSSFARPTTRDPVVYYHESVNPDRLDPALRHCRFQVHDRPALEQKILVDTPDLDSNDLSNREKLMQLLPVADVVLYVGSQEKYHDKLGWDLFLQQRQRRAFAFVLNKWDRCQHTGASGLRPDEDLLNDLKAEGFENPLLFRTCAQYWVDQSQKNGQAGFERPEGEQFPDLVRWLEQGLDQLEIEAIKAHGIGRLLHQLEKAVQGACPPDLSEAAEKTRAAWHGILLEEARTNAEVLLNTLEPYQREIEHHFALERQGQFRGLMGLYLRSANRLKYAGSTLRKRLPRVIRPAAAPSSEPPASLDLAEFTRVCTAAASDRQLDARSRALANRLLVAADHQGFPLNLLTGPTESASRIDWRQRYAQAVLEVLGQVEHGWSQPTGARFVTQNALVLLADWLPLPTLLAAFAVPLWRYFNDPNYQPALIHFFLPLVVVFVELVIFHILIVLFLPLHWQAIRDEFHRQLEERLRSELGLVYEKVPADVTEKLQQERQQVERLLGEVRQVTGWLERREQTASVTGLYGAR